MHFRIATLAAATFLGLALSACTHDADDTGPHVPDSPTARVYAGRLPNMCDDLLSPVAVAQLLDTADVGQRTYTYLAPGGPAGLLRGMTCQHGVRSDGTALTVTAQEFATRSAAKKEYDDGRSGVAGARDVRVARQPAALAVSGTASSLLVLDGALTIDVRLGRTAAGSSSQQTLVACARTVVDGLDGGR